MAESCAVHTNRHDSIVCLRFVDLWPRMSGLALRTSSVCRPVHPVWARSVDASFGIVMSNSSLIGSLVSAVEGTRSVKCKTRSESAFRL